MKKGSEKKSRSRKKTDDSQKQFREEPCEFCGSPSTQYIFAAFVCDSESCIDKAINIRGGPGGHLLKKGIQ